MKNSKKKLLEKKQPYPRIAAFGIKVHNKPMPHVKSEDLKTTLKSAYSTFCEMFGVQTQCVEGPYPWDVEAVLERMVSGKLIGTQAYFD